MKKLAIIFILFIAPLCKSYSQQYFDRTFGKTRNEIGQKILKENDSTLVLFGWGEEYSFYFVKCNLKGDTILTKIYDFDYYNLGIDIVQLPNNEYILVGENGGIIKISNEGEIDWIMHHNNYSFSSGSLYNDTSFVLTGSKKVFSHTVTIVDSGDIDSVFYPDIMIKQISVKGELINEVTFNYNDDKDETGTDIIKTTNGEIFIIGYSYKNGLPNLLLIGLDSELNTLIDTIYTYNGVYIGYNDLFLNKSNQLIITGEKYDYIKGRSNILVTKIDNLGNILWENQIDLWKDSDKLNCSGRGTSIIEAESGYLYVFGNLSDGTNGTGQIRDLFLLKMKNSGDTIFTKIFKNPGNKISGSIIEVSENKFAMLGASDFLSYGNYDMYLILSDSLGRFEATTGLHDKEDQVSNSNFIYPNPTSDYINIGLKNIQSVEIFDLQGRLQKITIGNQNKLWVGDIPVGLYFVQIKLENETLNRKVIIN